MRWAAVIALAAAGLAGCGGDSDDDNSGGEPTTGGERSGDTAVFESNEIGFTFEYPDGFTAETEPDEQVLGQVLLEPGGRVNAIKVRKTSEQELGTESYLDEFERDFERSVGEVEKREETVGDLEVGVLEFEDSFEENGETVEFTSTSYFFAGGGETWQLECLAHREHRDEIEQACQTALESVEF